MNLNKWLDNNPGMYFYVGLVCGPTGLAILDLIFVSNSKMLSNDKYMTFEEDYREKSDITRIIERGKETEKRKKEFCETFPIIAWLEGE